MGIGRRGKKCNVRTEYSIEGLNSQLMLRI
jgi:hypothetical protein